MSYIQNVKLQIIPEDKPRKNVDLSQKEKILMNILAVNKLKLKYLEENIERRKLFKQGIITNKHDVLVSPDDFYDNIKCPRKKARVLIRDNGLEIVDTNENLKTFYDEYGWILNNRINSFGLRKILLDSRGDIVRNIKYKEDIPMVIDYMSDVNNFYEVDVSIYNEGKHREVKDSKFWIPSLRNVKFIEPERIPSSHFIVKLLIQYDVKVDKFYAHFYYLTDYRAIRKNVTQGVGIYLSGIPYLTLAYEDGTIKTYDSFENNEEICNLVFEKDRINSEMREITNKISDEYYELKEKKHEIHHQIQEMIYEKIREYIVDIVKDNPEYICTNRPEFLKMSKNTYDDVPFFKDFNYSQYLYEFTYYKYFMKKLIQVCEEIDIPIFMTGIEYHKDKHITLSKDYFRVCSECGGLDKRYKPLLNEYFECSNPECKNFGSGNQNIKYNENCAKSLCKMPFTHKEQFKDKNIKSSHIILNYAGITDRMEYDDVSDGDIKVYEM